MAVPPLKQTCCDAYAPGHSQECPMKGVPKKFTDFNKPPTPVPGDKK